jgi:hypothetical protein
MIGPVFTAWYKSVSEAGSDSGADARDGGTDDKGEFDPGVVGVGSESFALTGASRKPETFSLKMTWTYCHKYYKRSGVGVMLAGSADVRWSPSGRSFLLAVTASGVIY